MCILAIFGNTNKISEQIIQDNLILILQELGCMPNKILIPTEGNSSIYIQDWAEALHIKTQLFQSDWIKNGKIAQIIRDDRMAKECSHALVFLSQTSNRLEKFAKKICLKKTVFTLNNSVLEQLEVEQKVLEPVRKSNKRTVQMLLKFQKKVEY